MGMTVVSYILVGFALAMDSVAVSLVGGLAASRQRRPVWKTALTFALTFGAFQGIMALAGWYAGGFFADWLQAVDHWVAFGLLALIGGNMIRESFAEEDEEEEEEAPTGAGQLLVAGLATSIDSLAVGLSYSLLDIAIWVPVLVISGVTAALCVPAALLGARLGHRFAEKAELLGGLILIAIGVRILVEHLGG